MTTSFQRQANTLLKDGGYTFSHKSGKAHEVWVKDGVPDIHVPGSPSGGWDSMLARIRRAVRKGTPLTPPSGRETDMPAPGKVEKPMGEKLLALASPYMVKKAAERVKKREAGDTSKGDPDRRWADETVTWLNRCLETYGAVWNTDLNFAAEALDLDASKLSGARTKCKAASYRTPVMPQRATMTGYLHKLPENAMISGGRGGRRGANAAKESVVTPPLAAAPPPPAETNGNEGRRLDQAGLTDEEHAAAERRMVEGHRRAEEERQALLREREAPAVEPVHGENGNGKPKSEMDVLVEMIREQALKETHSLTPKMVQQLRGMRDVWARHAEESRGMAAMLSTMLDEVEAKAPNAPQAQVAA